MGGQIHSGVNSPHPQVCKLINILNGESLVGLQLKRGIEVTDRSCSFKLDLKSVAEALANTIRILGVGRTVFATRHLHTPATRHPQNPWTAFQACLRSIPPMLQEALS